MVRFHWFYDGSQAAYVLPNGIELDEKNGIIHVHLQIELSGQIDTCPALLTCPTSYINDGAVKPVGLLLGHDKNTDYDSPFYNQIATYFANQGYVVVRYTCQLKEMRRVRLYESTLHAAAASPFARDVQTWVFAGHGNGARIAVSAAAKTSKLKAGYILLSYPLLEPAPKLPKAKQSPVDSLAPLLRLNTAAPTQQPILFINGELDYICPGANLKAAGEQLTDIDTRAVVLQNLDDNFVPLDSNQQQPDDTVVGTILKEMQLFMEAVMNNSVATCALPKLADLIPSTRVQPRVADDKGPASDDDEEEEEEEEQQQQQQQPLPPRSTRGQKAAPGLPPAVVAHLVAAGINPADPKQVMAVHNALQQQVVAQQQQQQQALMAMGANFPGGPLALLQLIQQQQQQQRKK